LNIIGTIKIVEIRDDVDDQKQPQLRYYMDMPKNLDVKKET